MRYDMPKVVVERPRRGSRYRYHNKRPRGTIEQLEALPTKEGMRRPYGYDCKEFSDLLGPLRGFLFSRTGRKWDDVYSEIRQRLNPNSTVQIHILSHVFQFVERNAKLDEAGRYSGNECARRSHDHHQNAVQPPQTKRKPKPGRASVTRFAA
jgi:hypothetical protein